MKVLPQHYGAVATWPGIIIAGAGLIVGLLVTRRYRSQRKHLAARNGAGAAPPDGRLPASMAAIAVLTALTALGALIGTGSANPLLPTCNRSYSAGCGGGW